MSELSDLRQKRIQHSKPRGRYSREVFDQPVTPADLISAVRRAVESGTIKGKLRPDDLRALRVMLRAYGHEEGLSAAINAWLNDRHLLVIPVDVGKDR